MGHLLACMINRADLLKVAVRAEQDLIKAEPIRETAGWGIGFYQADDVLHKKRPTPLREPFHWADVVQDVNSHCLVAHARDAALPNSSAENTHPFRMRQWLFVHSGAIDRFEAIRAQLVESLPDFIRRNIRGETDSEHIFHVLLSFLHDAGQLDANDPKDSDVISATRSTLALVDRLAAEVGAAPGSINFALTNGQRLYALRRGGGLMMVKRMQLPASFSEPPGGEASRVASAVRYALVTTGEVGPNTEGYEPIAPDMLVSVNRDIDINRYSVL